MLNNLINRVIEPITNLISEYIPDADKAAELESAIRLSLLNHEEALVNASRDVIVAEAQGESWLQRSWRPIIMLMFGAILCNNYILAPYVEAFSGTAVVLEIPDGMWGLLTVGLGGYVVGRTVEKTGSRMNINVGEQARDADAPVQG